MQNNYKYTNMNYVINIGTMYDCTTNGQKPRQTIVISEEQLKIVKTFASVRITEDATRVYKLNDCEFKISFHFDDPVTNSVIKLDAEKPPLGLIRKNMHDENRLKEIQQAMLRYAEKNKPFPSEWLEEYNSLIAYKSTI